MTARPAESYPRYSSRCSPSTRTGVASRLPTYPTIPHTLLVPPQWSAWLSVWLSAVHQAPQLALGHLRGPEPAAPELGRDQWPDLIVLLVLLLEFGMPPFHELVNGLPEVRGDVRHHSPSGRLGQPGRGRDMAEQLMRVVVVHGWFTSVVNCAALGKFPARNRAGNAVIYSPEPPAYPPRLAR